MSLIRACKQALPKHVVSRPIAVYSRANSTTPHPPVQTRDQQEKESTQITTPPERDVMVADAISGAPGRFNIISTHVCVVTEALYV